MAKVAAERYCPAALAVLWPSACDIDPFFCPGRPGSWLQTSRGVVVPDFESRGKGTAGLSCSSRASFAAEEDADSRGHLCRLQGPASRRPERSYYRVSSRPALTVAAAVWLGLNLPRLLADVVSATQC